MLLGVWIWTRPTGIEDIFQIAPRHGSAHCAETAEVGLRAGETLKLR